MILKEAKFHNYRNIYDESFNFSDEINIIFGKNAQGKTNVLEGIYNFSNGKSFRRVKDRELINFDKDESFVQIRYKNNIRDDNLLKIEYFKEKRKNLYYNNLKENKLGNFIGYFKSVLFCPEHLSIVKEEPLIRRMFIDNAISQLRPLYASYLIEYSKILEEKNSLLKNTEVYDKTFYDMHSILSEQLAHHSSYIVLMRTSYLKRLFKMVNLIMNEISSGKENITYNYVSKIIDENYYGDNLKENQDRFYNLMINNREKEILAKNCLYGSHKDDYEILIDEKSAKLFSSQGQQRSIALSMKLSEGNICFEETKEQPVYLFDDVLSELDRERKEYILSQLKNKQVIITSCDESDFSNIKNIKKIRAENGTFKEI